MIARTPTRTPVEDTETTKDLQVRLGRFARSILIVSGAMLAVSVTLELLIDRPAFIASIVAPGRIAHVAAACFALAVWRLCKRQALGGGVLKLLDAAMTISLCTSWALLGIGTAEKQAVEFSIILAMTYTIILRSVVVPSTFKRTLWISALAAVPILTFFYERDMRFIPGATVTHIRTFLVFATVWCVVGVLTASFNSRQLYGLRAAIREIGKLGQYTLESKLGEGGMGVVYRASHAMLRRPAAIKLLLPDRAGEQHLARFEREVQLTSRLAHPNTISIFDYGRTNEGVFYYVMEYLDGVDLEQLVKAAGPLDPARVIHILAQASGALAEAHAHGMLHRDIKPANIMLTTRLDEPDVVKVVDFGLVKTLADAPALPALSHANAIVGTPMYLAPESITSPDEIDARADLYALGAVGYFLLTGENVFSAKTIIEVCGKHLHEAPIPPSERLGRPLPSDLEALVLQCLAKAKDDRPASAAALRTSLLACEDAARYDITAARGWWETNRAEGRTRAAKAVEGPPTMTIDVRGRASVD